MTAQDAAAQLVGAWTLLSCEIRFPDGRPPHRPFGEDGRGRIIYAPSGEMSAVLSRGDRAESGAERLEDAHRASVDDKAAAFDSYLSYSGRWRLETNPEGELWVVHAVDLALVPSVVGSEQRRRVTFEGETLVLSYETRSRGGAELAYTLRWQRA